MAGIGASSSLPPIPAKVASPSRQRPLRLGDGNRSSCPEAAIRGGTRIGSVAGNPAFVGAGRSRVHSLVHSSGLGIDPLTIRTSRELGGGSG
jgi:hypothetical protein